MDVKVSVIVAIYKGAKTLPRCLDSLVTQKYPNIEIICVNDCSPDNSLEVLQQYQSNYPQIKIINHTINMNGGGADNTGIKASTGNYICIVDQDDALEPNAIEELVAHSENGEVDIVIGQWRCIYSDGEIENHQNLIVGGSREEIIKYAFMHGVRILGGIFKKQLYAENDLYYPEKVNWADNAIYNAILVAAQRICVIDTLIYNYYVDTESSASKQVSPSSIKDRIYTTNLMCSNCARVDNNGIFTDEINYRYMDLSTYTLELLTEIPFTVAKPMAEHLCAQISSMLPNKYFDKFEPQFKERLLNPVGYLKKERNKHIRKQIKGYFHSIRHNIVVAVKKLLGKDPTKSIYNL